MDSEYACLTCIIAKVLTPGVLVQILEEVDECCYTFEGLYFFIINEIVLY